MMGIGRLYGFPLGVGLTNGHEFGLLYWMLIPVMKPREIFTTRNVKLNLQQYTELVLTIHKSLTRDLLTFSVELTLSQFLRGVLTRR